MHRRRPGAEFGGDGKNFADQDFLMTFFRNKFPFLHLKFLMTFFKSSTMIFQFFLSFSRFSISLLLVMLYMTLSSREKSLFQTKIPWKHLFFTLCASDRHYFSKYLGTDAWAVPHLKFWG